jgi:septal ring factor EnvC (AmiA/AmiB activator)
MHLAWEASKEVKDVRVQSKQFENEIERLKRRVTHKEAVEVALLSHINQLEEEVLYWKTASEGVYVN